jgi:hypothetical protein
MKLTNEYQYIGRTNMISCASGWDYRILLYAKTKGYMDTGKHTVSVKQVMACNIMSSFYNFPTNGYVKVGGNTVESWTFQPVPNKAWNETWITVGGYSYGRWVDITEGSVEVDTGYGADTDITIESFWEMAYAGTEAWLPPYKETGTASIVVTLPKIIGASYITSVDEITIGKPCNVKWTPLASTFCYKLRFSIGDWSYTTEVIAPGSTSAYAFTGYTIPMEVANRITNDPSGDMKVELFSYLDSSCTTQIGSADEEIVTATVPDNSDTKPSVSMALDIVSALGSTFAGLYIQNLTKVSAEISGSGKYGASVEETRLVIGGAQYSNPCVSGFLTATGNVTVTGEAVDSRGYVGKAEKIITVIPYSRPAIVPVDGETGIVCARCDASGNFTDSGTYLRIKAKRFYSPIISDGVQKNRCLIQYRVNGGSWVTILSRTSASDEVDTGPISGKVSSVSSSYTIDIGVADDVGESSYTTIIVPTDEVTFHLRHGGNGAAFGEYSVDENVLAVAENWELQIKGDPKTNSGAISRGYADGRYMKKGDGASVQSPLAYDGDTLFLDLDTAVTEGSELPVTSGAVYGAIAGGKKGISVAVQANTEVPFTLEEGELVQVSFCMSELTSGDIILSVNGASPTGAYYWYTGTYGATYGGGIIGFGGSNTYASFHGFMRLQNGRLHLWGQDYRGNNSGIGHSNAFWKDITGVTSLTFTKAGTLSYTKL